MCNHSRYLKMQKCNDQLNKWTRPIHIIPTQCSYANAQKVLGLLKNQYRVRRSFIVRDIRLRMYISKLDYPPNQALCTTRSEDYTLASSLKKIYVLGAQFIAISHSNFHIKEDYDLKITIFQNLPNLYQTFLQVDFRSKLKQK